MNYKTKACRHFETGKCKLSGLCNFAHGNDELYFYQKMARADDKSLQTIDTLSQTKVNTSVQKIELLENQLDDFYHQQKKLLDQLKHFSLQIKLGCLRNDENISQMGANIIAVYNSAVRYTQEVGRSMDLPKTSSSLDNASPRLKENWSDIIDKETPANFNFIKMVDEISEPQLEIVKKQLAFILKSLIALYGNYESVFSQSLKSAQSAFANNQMLESSKHLQLVLYNQDIDSSVKQTHMKIVESAMSLKL